MSFVVESFSAGAVVCDTGQVTDADRRELDRAVREGNAHKWRGYWHPVPGANWGIGPLKTCWQLLI